MNSLIFFTPHFLNSDVVPHLLEHHFFLSRKSDAHSFFRYWTDLEWHLLDTQTTYLFDSSLPIDDILWMIKKPITGKYFSKNKKCIRDEYSNIGLEEKLYSKVWKLLYNKSINLSSYKSVKLDLLVQYQKDFYIDWSRIYTDSNNEILDYCFTHTKQFLEFEKIAGAFIFDKNPFIYYGLTLSNWHSIVDLFIACTLINYYLKWYYTFISPKYFHTSAYLRFYNDYAIIISPKISSRFYFDKWKKTHKEYFIQHLLSDSFSYTRNLWHCRLMLIF